MNTSSSWGIFCVCAALLGCSGAEWQRVEIDSAYRAPKALTITIVAPRAPKEVTAALASALVDELASAEIQATIVNAADGTAEANLIVGTWLPGSQGLRWLVGFGAGEGEIVVSVDTATIGVEGTVHGWVTGGLLGGDDENSAIAAGHLIGRTIATGRSDTTPRQPKTPHSMASNAR